VLKFMMIIVIAFAKSQQGHEERIPRAALSRVRLATFGVTSGVDQECTVLEHHDLGHTADEEATERSHPAIPHCTG
jgi:hypothetical protein